MFYFLFLLLSIHPLLYVAKSPFVFPHLSYHSSLWLTIYVYIILPITLLIQKEQYNPDQVMQHPKRKLKHVGNDSIHKELESAKVIHGTAETKEPLCREIVREESVTLVHETPNKSDSFLEKQEIDMDWLNSSCEMIGMVTSSFK